MSLNPYDTEIFIDDNDVNLNIRLQYFQVA